MFQTIKNKFIALSLIVIILSIGIPVGFLLDQLSENFRDRSILMVESATDLMIYGLNNSMMKGDQKSVQKIIEQISNNKTIDHIRIFNREGIIKYSTHPSEVGDDLSVIEPGHLEEKISEITKREIFLDKKTNVYKAIQPIIVEERCQACHHENQIIAYLDVDTDLTKAEINFYTGSVHMILLGGILIILLAFGYYLIFNKLINNPLNNFMVALDEIEKGNLDLRLPAKGKDEFSILNYHYNRMATELKYSRNKIDELHLDQLQRADKMVTLGELTASMAHDINNHSAIIMSRADYLLYESENNKSLAGFIDDLSVVNNQIVKISKITSNILKHSKKLPKTFSDFDLVKLVDSSLELVEPLIKKRKVNLVKDYKINYANINGDPNQIEQVVMNLVSNALDALNSGGKLKVTLKLSNENKFQLIVQDNGIGINEESLEKIFSPFYTNKEAEKGTGLGLYIVQNICKNHNADVKCESKLNEGTTFIITFNGGKNKND